MNEAGAHCPERATTINSCNGIFISEFIFRYAFPAKNNWKIPNISCKQTLFYFSFCCFQNVGELVSKTSAWKRAGSARKKINYFLLPLPLPPCAGGQFNPLRFIFYHPRSTDFEEKIEALLTGSTKQGKTWLLTKGEARAKPLTALISPPFEFYFFFGRPWFLEMKDNCSRSISSTAFQSFIQLPRVLNYVLKHISFPSVRLS